MGAVCLIHSDTSVIGNFNTITMRAFVVTLALIGSAMGSSIARDPKAISLFSVVTFPNDKCQTQTNGIEGVCFSSTECSDKGGTADGNCASGFGVCCKFQITACGGTVNENTTYIENKGYPTKLSTVSDSCVYTVKACQDDICQVRLDFDEFILPVESTGQCSAATNGAKLVADSPTGRDPPSICGTNTGLHMYVEIGTSSTDLKVTITTGLLTTSMKSWRIKVSQIECGSSSRAPADCVQYYTGAAGEVRSYGFPGNKFLAPQNMMTCIRRELGFCGIVYRTNAGIEASPVDPFLVSNEANAATGTSSTATEQCQDGRLIVPNYRSSNAGATTALRAGYEFCGTKLNVVNGTTVEGTVHQYRAPFGFITSHRDATVDTATGYSLLYTQNGCS